MIEAWKYGPVTEPAPDQAVLIDFVARLRKATGIAFGSHSVLEAIDGACRTTSDAFLA